MKQYLDLCDWVISEGTRKSNRTGVDTVGIFGAMMKFDLRQGFPVVTTKRFAWRSCVAEMLGFLRGYSSAAQFRELGCNVWDNNANKNEQWLTNPNRKGTDDLGRIYGVQARAWDRYWDQLKIVVNKLTDRIDDRRLIVTHWNPSELGLMALPPCHVLYQFGIEDGYLLNMCMYQRSCDLPLGVPFNISGYAWLLSVIAHVTSLTAGVFTHFLWDAHIYENQIELMRDVQLSRLPLELPYLHINKRIRTFHDLETMAIPDDFTLVGYTSHAPIKYPFSV